MLQQTLVAGKVHYLLLLLLLFSISFHDQIKAQRLVAEIAEKVELEGMTEDYGKLEKELEKASPLAIISKALQKFIDCSAISFSGAKDVSFDSPIGGQRRDQSPGIRASVPALKIDPSVEGIGCGAISLLKWNPVANLGGQATWNFLQTMDVPLRYVSTDCETLTRPAFPWQHERGGRRWWEEGMARLRTELGPWLDVLYARWRHFFQAMENSYAKLVDAKVKTGKFRVDGEHRAFANQKLQLRIFTTIVIFPGSKPIKYSSEKRDVDSQLAFVSSLQW
ncbi:5'-ADENYLYLSULFATE REDUCTASE 3 CHLOROPLASTIC [Salix purpurea]|uniref:5'-ADENYLYLSULFATE REDUCTASE 3 CHLOROPLASTIC n=1 Tax=Salix purpurea TaxID=77065 RepID=A0A9Q0P2L2_SALPP|nr:5'-ADENYLYLSULFATE REDUCTASE 3 CHLOROPLASTIC [Salix purpurea]